MLSFAFLLIFLSNNLISSLAQNAACPSAFWDLADSLEIRYRWDTSLELPMNLNIQGQNVPATRHHIIPLDLLTTFWNRVVSENSSLRAFGRFLLRLVNNANTFYEADSAQLMDPQHQLHVLRHGQYVAQFISNGQIDSLTNRLTEDQRRGMAVLQILYTWMAGNIFIGVSSRLRHDDPSLNRNGFEYDADNIVGEVNYRRLRDIYGNMTEYISRNGNDRVQLERIIDLLVEIPNELYITVEDNWIHLQNLERYIINTTPSSPSIVIRRLSHGNPNGKRRKKRETNGQELLKALAIKKDPFCLRSFLSGLMGSETDNGNWKYFYRVQFPFTIGGRTFFYGQSIEDDVGHYWFLQELLPNGKMGCPTDEGHWAYNYDVQLPFSIGGRTFLYGSRLSGGHNWFIQELLPNGKMGQETDHGFWNEYYKSQFTFSIGTKTFLYGQSIVDGHNWFIQELLPNGKMGQETDHGFWEYNYEVQVSFSIDGKTFFYGQSNVDGHNWFIQELLPNGKMGQETDHGFWKKRYSVQHAFNLNGNQFLFGQSIVDGNNWFIQKILRNGKMGMETTNGEWYKKYEAQFTFAINGRQFLYGQSLQGNNWFIQEIL